MKQELFSFLQMMVVPTFTTCWPFVILALVALFGTFFGIQKKACSKRVRILHVLSVVLLFWMLLQWNLVHTAVGPREITILLDDSPSMALTDAQNSASEIAVKLEKEWTSKERNVKIVRLSERTTEPEKTPLGDGLTNVLRSGGGKPGVVPNSRRVILLSDGLSNVGSPLEESISEARNRNVSVFPIPLGSPTPLPFVRIESVVSPKNVFQGDEIQMRIKVSTNSKNFVLDVFENKSIVFQKSYEPRENPSVLCEAAWKARAPGEKNYSIRVSFEPQIVSEPRLTSHTVQIPLAVLDRRRHVLLAASRPSWEYRYLRNLLKRSERFDLSVLSLGKSSPADANDPILLPTPPTPDTWPTYDIVILCDPELTPENTMFFEILANSKLRENTEKPQLLVFIAGQHFKSSAWSSALFRDFFPFPPIASEVTSIPSRDGLGIDLTPIGRTWQILPNVATHENFITYSAVRIPYVSPDAQILAQFSQSGKSFPAILFQPRGRGCVLFLAMDDTWRLRRGNIETYNKFWATLLTHGVTFLNDSPANEIQNNSNSPKNQDLQTIIPDYPVEWERTQRDDFVLRTLANQTGGRCFASDKIDDLVREIRIREQYDDPRIGRRETAFSLWNLLPVWLLFGFLVLVRWAILRRFPQEGGFS